MEKLNQLGMKKNWIYEVLISSYDGNVPHAAPFGVKTQNFGLVEIEMYKGSNTLKNILANREFVINTVADPASFYDVLYEKERIKYGLAKMVNAPLLTDAPISMEVRIADAATTKQKVIIKADILYIHIRYKGKLINRAGSLLLESLILATRISHFPEGKAEALLKENYRVVKKVAPESKYQVMMQSLLNKFCD